MSRLTNDNNSLVTYFNSKSQISEGYRKLRTNIQFSSIDSHIKKIMVASAEAGEGKTTTISNLAVTYAQEGKKVLLIDADLRNPSLHQVFSVPNHIGLSSVLSNQYGVEEVLRESYIDNLQLFTSGPIPPNPSEMIGSNRMKRLMEKLEDQYDVIMFDTPPVLAVTDALIVSSLCDGVLLVVNSGKVKKELVKKTKAALEHVNARILGAILNNIKNVAVPVGYGEK
ncbi:CpsD/CapB family tyrosine-protein kinase [Paenibacillus sp. FSL R5-0517]|uniref:CpsD/CapB family tyrosine-protein kinase n=1 Tax=unclassified Paenibacillus TaxID=185978 RepID=UPI0030D86F4B